MPGLCVTCRTSHIMEFANGTSATFCFQFGSPGLRITNPVIRCNEYDARGRMNSHEMEKIAWVVKTDRSGLAAGFRPPTKKDDDD